MTTKCPTIQIFLLTLLFLLVQSAPPTCSPGQYGDIIAARLPIAADCQATHVTMLADGSTIVAGTFRTAVLGIFPLVSNSSSIDGFVAKLNTTMGVVWVRTFGGISDETVQGVAADSSGNVYVTGTFETSFSSMISTFFSAGKRDVFLLKYSSIGILSFAKTFGGPNDDMAAGIVATTTTCHVAGTFQISMSIAGLAPITASTLNTASFVAQFNAILGTANWVTKIDNSAAAIAKSIAQNPIDGAIYVTGFFSSDVTSGSISFTGALGNGDVFLFRYDATGNTTWGTRVVSSGMDYGQQVYVDPSSQNVYLGGFFEGLATFSTISITSTGIRNLFIAKYSSAGTIAWVQKFSGSKDVFEVTSIASISSIGQVFVSGIYDSTVTCGALSRTLSAVEDSFIAKLNDTAGDILTLKRISGPQKEYIRGLATTNSVLTAVGYASPATTTTIDAITIPNIGSNNGPIMVQMDFTCVSCPLGTFSNANNAISSLTCTNCPTNMYANTLGQTNCTLCPVDTYIGTSSGLTSKSGCSSTCALGQYVNALNPPTAVRTIQGNDEWYSIVSDNAGNLFATAWLRASSSMTIGAFTITAGTVPYSIIAKFNSMGQAQWLVNGSSNSATAPRSLAIDSQGNLVMTGQYEGIVRFGGLSVAANGTQDAYLVKVNGSSGAIMWLKSVGGPNPDDGVAVTCDLQNNIYWTGTIQTVAYFDSITVNSGSGSKIAIAKFNPSGTVVWATFGGAASENSARSVVADSFGFVYIAGYYKTAATFDAINVAGIGQNDIFVAKMHAGNGSFVWVASAGSTLQDEATSIAVDATGTPIVSGYFSGTASFGTFIIASPGTSVFVAKLLSLTGTFVWVSHYGSSGTNLISASFVDSLANIYITGYFEASIAFGAQAFVSAGGKDMFVVKLNSIGAPIWAFKNGGQATDLEQGRGLTVDNFGLVTVSGVFSNMGIAQFLPTCASCPIGTFTTNLGIIGADACTKCAASKYSQKVGAFLELDCENCFPGTFSLAGSSTCQQCPIGTYTVLPGVAAASCLACPLGTYSNQQAAATCQQCFGGTFAETVNSTSCKLCQPGTFSAASAATSNTTCQKCPLGSFAANSGSTSCTLCGPGTFANTTGQSSCTPCPRGTFSFAINATDSRQCLPCSAGSYAVSLGASSDSVCILCPSGTYSSIVGASSASVCNACPLGTYSAFAGASSVANCSSCISGTYSTVLGSSSSTTCLPCQAGTYSSLIGATSPNACIGCGQGTFSTFVGATSISTCLHCNAGTFSSTIGASSSALCSPCAIGTYSTISGATSSSVCLPCGAGNFSDAIGSTQCKVCSAGTYTNVEGQSYCQSCPSGTYNSQLGSNFCIACEPGSYSDAIGAKNSSACLSCPKGSYSNIYAANSLSSCQLCPTGYYSANTSAISFSTCVPCPVGSFSTTPGATSITSCLACGVGTFSAAVGQSTCQVCSPGSYQDEIGKSSCKICASGSFADAPGKTSCQLCPIGSYSTTSGALSRSVCLPCAIGTYSNISGAVSCSRCDVGTFASAENSTFCLPCTPGNFSNSLGQSKCQSCPQGTYASSYGATSCAPCAIGTYGNMLGASSVLQCLTCPVGTFGTVQGATQCSVCPANTYANQTGGTTCTLCPLGTQNTNAGGQSIDACLKCQPGYYRSAAFQVCQPCPIGYYNAQSGSQDVSACLAAPIGFYVNKSGASDRDLISCPNGSFGTISGATTSSACTPCGMGLYSATSGASSAVCQSCQAGNYANQTGSTSCLPCPKGTISSAGASVCLPCQTGTFTASEASTSCIACLAGTYMDTTGASLCLPCKAGFFVNETGATSCKSCPENTICRIGSTVPMAVSNLNRSNVELHDPYFHTDSATDNPTTLRSVFTIRIVFLLICAIVVALVLVLTIIPIFIHGIKPIMPNIIDKALSALDMFSMKHFTQPNQVLLNKPMAIGGYFAILFIILAITAVALSLVDLFGNNIADRTSIIPVAALPLELQNLTNPNTFSIKILLHSFNLDDCTANTIKIAGFSPTTNHKMEFKKYPNSTCITNFVCNNCNLTGNTQQFQIAYTSPFVSAGAIDYYVHVPHFITNTSFGLFEKLAPTDAQSIFKGPEPTKIDISLIQSYYSTLATDYLFNNVFSQSSLQSRTRIGYIATHFPTTLGSTVNDTTFASKQGLSLEFAFSIDSTVFRIEQEAKSSLLDFIGKVAALIGAVSSVLLFAMAQVETIQQCIAQRMNKQGAAKQELVDNVMGTEL